MTFLWAVDCFGKVFTLSTAHDHWTEIVDTSGLGIKKVCAQEFFTWAIGGDHQIYIYVPVKDIPIRYRVVTYENERWNPVNGFCDKLLPTDRPHFSSSDGLTELPKEALKLPSNAWEWEEGWYVEDNLKGQPLEPEGWTYAVDFPATYGPSQAWNSMVRRRKWIRYRRFCSMNRWCPIPGLHKETVKEPFIDVSIGGTEIPGGEAFRFSVWAVSITGSIVFREGVTEDSPEGERWVFVKIPDKYEVSQVSVGPTGLAWAVTWSGEALVRSGVNRTNAMGSSWLVVLPPSPEEGLTQVSVGKEVVWALTRNKKVWFRKGIDGYHSGENDKAATGISWIEMFGTLACISVGYFDQVFGITEDSHDILLRTGVCPTEMCGRTWKPVTAPVELDHIRRCSSLSSLESSNSQLGFCSSTADTVSLDGRTQNVRKISSDSAVSCPILNKGNGSSLIATSSSSLSSENLQRHSSGDIDCDFDLKNNERTVSYSNLDEAPIPVDISDIMWHSPVEAVSELPSQERSWLWISASSCSVDAESLPDWFCKSSALLKSAVDEPWYKTVILELSQRYKKEMEQFSNYPSAIDKTFWVKTATCKWYKDHYWVKCLLELLQHEDVPTKSTLTWHHSKDMVSVHLTYVTCTLCLPDWNKSILLIHTSKRTTKGSAYKFAFTSNEDLEDWLASLNTSCQNVNGISKVPDKNSFWTVTVNGDVYFHNASSNTPSESLVHMKWSLLGGGHLRLVETCPNGITWGLGYNCTAWFYNKGYGGGPFHGIPGSNSSVGPMSDIRCFYIYENQRWNPLSGFTSKGLPTDRYMWSDKSGRMECTKENTHLPSGRWQWISDWCIDYKTTGGTDPEGWQYATDFPRKFHGQKRFTDYVRRRRWFRKCRLTTSGPWGKLGNTPLLDISFQMDSEKDEIAVWAVAANGDVLYRYGVTKHCPRGLRWDHVPADNPFCSISVGNDGAVWAVAKDGSAQLRHGVSANLPLGQYWCHVEPPQMGCPLRQISAGKTKVLAVDESDRLWARQEIVCIFKEGTHWKLISEDIKQVSIGPSDQIWCIKNNCATRSGVISGVLCRRSNVSGENPYGTDWEQGIGGCWNHICVRGTVIDKE